MKAVKRRAPGAFSLTEVLVATTIFSFVVLFSAIYMDRSRQLWRQVNANQDAGQTLRKASLNLRESLTDASGKDFETVDNGMGSARMGQAFWFLSARDPATGQFVTADDGRPFWQKNVLYYLTVPQDHDTRYGVNCQQFDRVCPHKILLRKVIDRDNPTTPTSAPEDEETLMTEAEAQEHLTRPATLDLSAMEALATVVEVDYVCGHLLDMTLTTEVQDGKLVEAEVLIEAGLIEATRNRLAVGRDEFNAGAYVLSKSVGFVPRNF